MKILLAILTAIVATTTAPAQLAKKDTAINTASQILDKESTAPPPAPKTQDQIIQEYEAAQNDARVAANAAFAREFLSKTRQQDPFGVPLRTPIREQTPEEMLSAQAAQDQASAGATAFESAIRSMVVGAVNVGRREFLIGSDNLFEGDAFDMQYGGQQFRAWVKEVTTEYIAFIDQQTGTVAEIRVNFNLLPPTQTMWGASGTTTDMPSNF